MKKLGFSKWVKTLEATIQSGLPNLDKIFSEHFWLKKDIIVVRPREFAISPTFLDGSTPTQLIFNCFSGLRRIPSFEPMSKTNFLSFNVFASSLKWSTNSLFTDEK